MRRAGVSSRRGSSRSSRWRQSSLRKVERMFGLMASNVFCGNRDDHSKNVAFAHRESGGWTLSGESFAVSLDRTKMLSRYPWPCSRI
ncbi:HipA domain-containing protein [Raoultibacter massiliensis]|uniref:HipA domain-containing protein n=1 Tax=Raoultibacter massiliensis TaxID=1852371 RepID=UPI003A8F0400